MKIKVDDHETLQEELLKTFPEKMDFTLTYLASYCEKFEDVIARDDAPKVGCSASLQTDLAKNSDGNDFVDFATVERFEDGWYVTRLERRTTRPTTLSTEELEELIAAGVDSNMRGP